MNIFKTIKKLFSKKVNTKPQKKYKCGIVGFDGKSYTQTKLENKKNLDKNH